MSSNYYGSIAGEIADLGGTEPCCRQFGSDECECLDGCECGCLECWCDPDDL